VTAVQGGHQEMSELDNGEKLRTAFATALGISVDRVVDELSYEGIPEWDSVAHMALVAEIEGAFDVMLDTDDILALSSVAVARNILSRHAVAF
ncbi:MAG TPA: acyl carrier protein, partial [Burkholderiaceae bacterium]|nr:acyl carrier protein [Burkholderiaceae bacterium]